MRVNAFLQAAFSLVLCAGFSVSADGQAAPPSKTGNALTPEASLTKLVYLVGLEGGADQVKRDMQRDLRGELTPVSEPDPGAPRGR